MITQEVELGKSITQEAYKKVLEELDIHRLECPCCGHAGCLIGHGHYQRGVKESGKLIKLQIQRLKCKECEKTHALLPSNIVPYTQVRVEEQVEIIRESEGKREYEAIMARNYLIDLSEIRAVIRRYQKNWKEKLTSWGLEIKSSVTKLIRESFEHGKQQFMQIRRTANKLFLKPT